MRLHEPTDQLRGLLATLLIVVSSVALAPGVATAQEAPDQEAIEAMIAPSLVESFGEKSQDPAASSAPMFA